MLPIIKEDYFLLDSVDLQPEKESISAKELMLFLGLDTTHKSRWVKDYLSLGYFVENKDYVIKNSEHYFSFDMALFISAKTNNNQGIKAFCYLNHLKKELNNQMVIEAIDRDRADSLTWGTTGVSKKGRQSQMATDIRNLKYYYKQMSVFSKEIINKIMEGKLTKDNYTEYFHKYLRMVSSYKHTFSK